VVDAEMKKGRPKAASQVTARRRLSVIPCEGGGEHVRSASTPRTCENRTGFTGQLTCKCEPERKVGRRLERSLRRAQRQYELEKARYQAADHARRSARVEAGLPRWMKEWEKP
jgi:hypothetical protein